MYWYERKEVANAYFRHFISLKNTLFRAATGDYFSILFVPLFQKYNLSRTIGNKCKRNVTQKVIPETVVRIEKKGLRLVALIFVFFKLFLN